MHSSFCLAGFLCLSDETHENLVALGFDETSNFISNMLRQKLPVLPHFFRKPVPQAFSCEKKEKKEKLRGDKRSFQKIPVEQTRGDKCGDLLLRSNPPLAHGAAACALSVS